MLRRKRKGFCHVREKDTVNALATAEVHKRSKPCLNDTVCVVASQMDGMQACTQNCSYINRTIFSIDQVIKSTEEILLQPNLDEKLSEVTLQQTITSSKKTFRVTRRSMRCLQQPKPGGNNNNCWLNDEVAIYYVLSAMIRLSTTIIFRL